MSKDRRHYWQYLVTDEGLPAQFATITVYNVDTGIEMFIFDSPTDSSTPISPQGTVTTDAKGYFEFWVQVESNTNKPYGDYDYPLGTRGNIKWSYDGVMAGEIKDIDLTTSAKGIRGRTGVTGAQGSTGVDGPIINGATGAQGEYSAQGDIPGKQGVTGPTGKQGATGYQGVHLEVGPTGLQGSTGKQGPTGLRGPTGYRGPTGAQGGEGLIGPDAGTAPRGYKGDTGPQGDKGPRGNDCYDQGLKGKQGATGPTGYQGKTYTSNVIGGQVSGPSVTVSLPNGLWLCKLFGSALTERSGSLEGQIDGNVVTPTARTAFDNNNDYDLQSIFGYTVLTINEPSSSKNVEGKMVYSGYGWSGTNTGRSVTQLICIKIS